MIQHSARTHYETSTSSIASIEKVQLQILGQLYAIRSQDLSFFHKNDPLYGSPQNQQLRKSTATSPPKSTASYQQLPHPLNRQLHKSTAITTPENWQLRKSTAVTIPENRQLRKSTIVSPQKSSVTQSTTDTPSPVESNAPRPALVEPDTLNALKSTVDALEPLPKSTIDAIIVATTMAVPHTLTSLTTMDPEKSSSFT
jgi:hypothetical protein